MRTSARRTDERAAPRRPGSPPPHPLLALQASAGNQAVVRHLARFASPDEEVERVMEAFARGRVPLVVAMNRTVDEAERRGARLSLQAYDRPHLARLRALGLSKRHPDPAVQDMVLAALQLEAIADAEGALMRPADAEKEARRAVGAGLRSDWCGMFAVEKFLDANLDDDLKRGFLHVDNVHHYFTYRYEQGAKARVKKWIHADDAWHELRAYHEARGSLRRWLTADALEKGGELDIRAGDIALIDRGAKPDGQPDHIVMVHSYDPATRHLRTIGGNDRGFQVDVRDERGPVSETVEELQDAAGVPLRKHKKGTAKVGMKRPDLVNVFGVGRPSIVDFEDHRYDNTSQKFPPSTT